jgi:hypothetical protein
MSVPNPSWNDEGDSRVQVTAYYESLTRELEALKDRVRNFSVETPHWQTDGEWKETVLRTLLEGHLPAHIEPVRGFVVTPLRGSGQIDIILYDNRKPVLFRNGDLVFVSPDAVAGIIEVKSRIASAAGLRKALRSLADDAEVIHAGRHDQNRLFVGLFSYETKVDHRKQTIILRELQDAASQRLDRVVSHVCLGCSSFTRYWEVPPGDLAASERDLWHSYHLPNWAAGYFISNMVAAVAGESVDANESLWYPYETKELRRVGRAPLVPMLDPAGIVAQ